MGAEVTFVPSNRVEDLELAIRPNTRVIYFETPSNPTLEIIDIAELARMAKSRGIPTLIDNTFASPALQQPLKLGVTASVHSPPSTFGHGDAMGGIVAGPKDYISTLVHEVIALRASSARSTPG
jgi:cystathionine beta-lyase/cystathionine gamma-synthase